MNASSLAKPPALLSPTSQYSAKKRPSSSRPASSRTHSSKKSPTRNWLPTSPTKSTGSKYLHLASKSQKAQKVRQLTPNTSNLLMGNIVEFQNEVARRSKQRVSLLHHQLEASRSSGFLKSQSATHLFTAPPIYSPSSQFKQDYLLTRQNQQRLFYERLNRPSCPRSLTSSGLLSPFKDKKLSIFTEAENELAQEDLTRLDGATQLNQEKQLRKVSSASLHIKNIKKEYTSLAHRLNQVVDFTENLQSKRTYEVTLPPLKTPYTARIELRGLDNPIVISIKQKIDHMFYMTGQQKMKSQRKTYKVIVHENNGMPEYREREPIFSETNPEKITLFDGKDGKPFVTHSFILNFYSLGKECTIQFSYLSGVDLLPVAKVAADRNAASQIIQTSIFKKGPMSEDALSLGKKDELEPSINYLEKNLKLASMFGNYKKNRIKAQSELYLKRKLESEKKRDSQIQNSVRKKVFFLKRWELLKEEKKKHQAQLIQEHEVRKNLQRWVGFVVVGNFMEEFEKLFQKKKKEALKHQQAIDSANVIQRRWTMHRKNKGLDNHLLSVVQLRHMNTFVGHMYSDQKSMHAREIVKSYLEQTAAKQRLFSCFMKFTQRVSSIQKHWKQKLKLYKRIAIELELLWTGERAKMIKELIRQRKAKCKQESQMISLISDSTKEVLLDQYLKLCRKRWAKIFKNWFKKTYGYFSDRGLSSANTSLRLQEEKTSARGGRQMYFEIRSFDDLGLNGAVIERVIKYGVKRGLASSRNLEIPKNEPIHQRRSSTFLRQKLNQSQPKRGQTLSLKSLSPGIQPRLTPRKSEKKLDKRFSPSELSSVKVSGRCVGKHSNNPKNMLKISQVSRAGTLKRMQTIFSSSEEKPTDRNLDKTAEKSKLVTLLFKNVPPPYIWRPGEAMTRDMVRLASKVQGPDELLEVLFP